MASTRDETARLALDLHALLSAVDRADGRTGSAERAALLDRVLHGIAAVAPSTDPPIRGLIAALADAIATSRPPVDAEASAWTALRAACEPVYEALAAALRDQGTSVPYLRPTNHVRNAYHVANAVGVVLLVEYLLTDWTLRIGVAGAAATVAWSMEVSRRHVPRANQLLMTLFGPVAHPHERHRINSATWYTTAVLILAVVFPLPAAVAGLSVLGLGDPVAAVVGRRWGRFRIVQQRTLEGTVAFSLAGTLAAAAALAAWHPTPGALLLAQAAAAGVAGAVGELLSGRLDDNLVVPIVGASAMVAVTALAG